MDRPLGLIAGQGRLPLLTAQHARAQGRKVVCVGLANQYDPELPGLCDQFGEAGIIQLGKWIKMMRRWGVGEAVMIGRVSKARMYEPGRWLKQLPDWRAAQLWYRKLRHDRRDVAVLTAVADELADEGITLIDSTTHLPEHLATQGVLTRRPPTEQQRGDAAFAWPLLREVNQMDIGQAMAVKERDVIAVEAMEGTDRMIARAGELCKHKGWTLIKAGKADQDMRFDVPTVGPTTIENLHKAGAGCLVVEASRVILVDKPALLELADKLKIAVVGMV